MDRDTFLRMLKSEDGVDIFYIIKEYCLEMGKPKDKTEQFVALIQVIPFGKELINRVFSYSFSHFMKKFNIVTLLEDNEPISYY